MVLRKDTHRPVEQGKNYDASVQIGNNGEDTLTKESIGSREMHDEQSDPRKYRKSNAKNCEEEILSIYMFTCRIFA